VLNFIFSEVQGGIWGKRQFTSNRLLAFSNIAILLQVSPMFVLGQVEIQRRCLGQYYQRFYPSSLATASQKLMALGAAMNYKILLKYDSQAVGVGSGEAAWQEFATHANYDEVAQAILQAQFLFDNLYALGMVGKGCGKDFCTWDVSSKRR
jgi:hypothetical protein